MKHYTVRTGQNIYDIALNLYGTIEGIFDLLISNEGVSMESTFSYGDVLNYHEEFVINSDIKDWLDNNGVIVKNGEHTLEYQSIDTLVKEHIIENHQDIYEKLSSQSTDEQSVYWDELSTPMMAVSQYGQLAGITVSIKENTHLIIDWGDYSDILILEGENKQEIEHCYKSAGTHQILMYGDATFLTLDISNINGVHYPLKPISADVFVSAETTENMNALITTK